MMCDKKLMLAGMSFAILTTISPAHAIDSTCFGTVSNGYLQHGVRLPSGGSNFSAYSSLGIKLGRNYVHSKVAVIVSRAYRALQDATPNKKFVYGETGWANGGRIRPNKTHRNGLSVDFMVPVTDASGLSVPLPTSVINKFGYGIDFDENAKFQNYTIDFESIAEHLYQLDKAAKAEGYGIALVIFEPQYMPKLLATRKGAYLKSNITFMQGKAWIRHDEHYHVNFAIPCASRKPG